jgi:hypothetical protein
MPTSPISVPTEIFPEAPPTEALPIVDSGPIPHYVNSVDATIGKPLVERVLERKAELEALLDGLDDKPLRADIELALSTVEPFLAGDLKHVPPVVMIDLNRWLERTKHIGERPVVS